VILITLPQGRPQPALIGDSPEGTLDEAGGDKVLVEALIRNADADQ